MTAACCFQLLREIIALQTTDEAFDGEIELDESYFGGHREGKRGRGAGGKWLSSAFCSVAARSAKVIPDAASATQMPIIEKKVAPTVLYCLYQLLEGL